MIQFTVSRGRDRVDDVTAVQVSDSSIRPSSFIKSLGVTLDSKLTFDQHVSSVCRACYFHIRALKHVRDSLPDDVARTVACSIVGSRLDYCNALYAGMFKSNVARLQRVLNALARTVLRRGKYEHTTPALRELHWLPIEHRITYKLVTLAHRIKSTGLPVYLRELLTDYEPARPLRSSSRNLLCQYKTKLVVASRGFRHSAAAARNNLPDNIRCINSLNNFKLRLKTHLFKLSFTA